MNTEGKNKRVVFTMGGKGGIGKTGLMVALAEWFEANEIPFTLLDLDTENKARGSLKHFFNGSVAKVNNTPAVSTRSSIISNPARRSSLLTWEQVRGRWRATGSMQCMRMSRRPRALHCSRRCHARPRKR
jgi:hypothetical protein